MKKILVTGSIAYDHLMTFDGLFSDSLIKEKLKNLSVSFLAKTHDQEFGGCAGNIAYNLKLLNCEPLVLGVAGKDFDQYEKWFKKCRISTKNIFIDKSKNTASAYVLSDNLHNQFTIFSPGAMESMKGGLKLKGVKASEISCAIIAPEPPKRMMYFGRYFSRLKIPFIFDPGQAIPALKKEEILELIAKSLGMIANEYEIEIICKKLSLNEKRLIAICKFMIKTTGKNGCELHANGKLKKISAVKNVKIVDVTGCGDAFRAGFLSAYVEGLSLEKACERANKVASCVVGVNGTQNHKISFSSAAFNFSRLDVLSF